MADQSTEQHSGLRRVIGTRGRAMAAALMSALGGAAAVIGILSFLDSRVPEYKGEVTTQQQQQDFADFLGDHPAEIVRLDISMQADQAPSADETTGMQFFAVFIDCPDRAGAPSIEAGCTGMEYAITIGEARDAVFGYNQGANYLVGYFTVRPNAGVHQGFLSTSLIGVRTEDAK